MLTSKCTYIEGGSEAWQKLLHVMAQALGHNADKLLESEKHARSCLERLVAQLTE